MGNCFTNKHSDRSTKNVNKPTHVGSEDLNFSTLLANEAVKIEEDAQPGFSNEMQQKMNKFFKDSEEIANWINTQLIFVASEECGKDLDDIDCLIHNFDIFQSDLIKVCSQCHNLSMWQTFLKISRPLIGCQTTNQHPKNIQNCPLKSCNHVFVHILKYVDMSSH